jgi:hypothetical protein
VGMAGMAGRKVQTPNLITEIEAVERFNLKRTLQRYSSGFVSSKEERLVRLYEGDLEIDGNLLVDWSKQWRDAHTGMIVTGNLTVKGDVLNTNINDGPFLFVTGNLVACNLLSGGGEIHIEGDAQIKDLVIGEYNDGVLTIRGELQCRLLIIDDHHVDIDEDRRKCATYSTDLPPSVDELKLSDYLVDEINFEVQEEPYEYETVDVYEEILPRLINGLPVLRKKGTERKAKTLADWTSELSQFPERISKVPKSMHTPELVMPSVKVSGWWLDYVSENAKTREVCQAAVENDGRALEYVPENLKDLELCTLAVKQTGEALKYVPQTLHNQSLFELAIKTWGPALHLVPEKLRSPELCMMAVTNDGDILELVPKGLRTPDLCLTAMHNLKYGSVEAVPRKVLTEEMCLLAVRQTSSALEKIPKDMRTRKVCLEAIQNYGGVIEQVPREHLDKEMLTAAVQKSPEVVLRLNSMGVLNEDLCVEAATSSGFVLMHIPRQFRTERVCLAAVKDWEQAFEYVPSELRELVLAELSAKK